MTVFQNVICKSPQEKVGIGMWQKCLWLGNGMEAQTAPTRWWDTELKMPAKVILRHIVL